MIGTKQLTISRRNDVIIGQQCATAWGGHCGHAAALYAVENSAADAVGGVQVTTNSDGAHRLVLMFSAEIAATPLLQHTTGTNNEEKIKALTEDALLAYRFSTQAVEFLVMNYIWPRAVSDDLAT